MADPAPTKTPATRLHLRLSGEVRAAPAASADGLVVATRDGRLIALDPDSGEQRWQYRTMALRGSSPAIAEGTVYVAEIGGAGRLHAVNLATGEARWTAAIGPTTVSPSVGNGAVIVASERLGGIAAFETSDGSRRWSIALDGPPRPVAIVGDLVIAAAGDSLSAWDIHDARPAWTTEVGQTSGPPAALGDLVVVAVEGGAVAAVQVADGAIRWRRHGLTTPLGLPAIDGESVYIVAGSSLLALAASDGAARWHATAAPGVAVTIAGDAAIVRSTSTTLSCLDRATGRARWTTEIPDRLGTPPVVAHGAIWISLRVDLDGEASLLALREEP